MGANDEMEQAFGHGWAELQGDGSLEGEICLENGDTISFVARRSIIIFNCPLGRIRFVL